MLTLEQLRNDYQKYNPKGHWFDADTIRYWGTEFETGLYAIPGEATVRYFVTSEDDFYKTKREYSVRRYDVENHNISTLGARHESLDSAVAAIYHQGALSVDGMRMFKIKGIK